MTPIRYADYTWHHNSTGMTWEYWWPEKLMKFSNGVAHMWFRLVFDEKEKVNFNELSFWKQGDDVQEAYSKWLNDYITDNNSAQEA